MEAVRILSRGQACGSSPRGGVRMMTSASTVPFARGPGGKRDLELTRVLSHGLSPPLTVLGLVDNSFECDGFPCMATWG